MTTVLQPEYGPEVLPLLPPEIVRQVLDLARNAQVTADEKQEKEERERRIAAHEQFASEQDEGRRRARMRREEAELSGELAAEAELFRDMRLKPRIAEAHDFEVQVRTPIVQGLFFRNSLTWVAGQSGTFKSFVTADLAFRYGAEDMDYHGRRMTSGRSLLIVAEGAAAYADRKAAWERQHERKVENVSIYPFPVQLGDTLKEMPALISYLREEEEAGRGYGLVVIDTQAMCTVGIEENGSEMNLVINMLHQVREVSGACVLVVHHFGKNKTAGMRGSSMIYAAADTVCVLKRENDALDVTLSTAQADEGKQKDANTEKDFLTLEMVAHPVGEDYFGDPVFSLVPVAADRRGTDVHEAPQEAPQELPWVTEGQMDSLKLVAFYEHRGATPSDMAAKWTEERGPIKNARQNVRNRMVELSKIGLVTGGDSKGSWRISPLGVAVIARQLAAGESWVERAAPRRRSKGVPGEGQGDLSEGLGDQVSPQVSGGSAKPASETSET